MQGKRVALVTGANQGVGLQVAKDLVRHGFAVLIGSRSLERGVAAAQEVGPDGHPLQLDVTDPASITAAADRIGRDFQRLDVLVQNAAISNTNRRPDQSVEDHAKSTCPSLVSFDEMRAIWETNVFGVLAVYQAMLPLLRQSADACIVNVSSGAGSLTRITDPLRLGRQPRHLRPLLPRVQDGPERADGRHGHRVGTGGDPGQRPVARVHQDEPERICGHADG